MKIKSPIGFLALWSAFLVSSTLAAQSPSLPQTLAELPTTAWHPAICADDLTGDGVVDCVLSAPGAGADGVVGIYDGANGELLATVTGSSSHRLFGALAMAGPDINGDGRADLMIASLMQGAIDTAELHVFAGASFKPMGQIVQVDSQYLFLPTADIDSDGVVGAVDITALLTAVGTLATGSDAHLDLDKDGFVTANDVAIGVCALGVEVHGLDLSDGIAEVGDGFVPLSESTNLQQLRAGLIGCIICWIRCGSRYAAAARCIDEAVEARRRCWEDEATDPLEVADCLDAVRQSTLDCLASVAQAAGSCGECVVKCGPQVASVQMPLTLPGN